MAQAPAISNKYFGPFRWKINGKSVASVPFNTSMTKTALPATGPITLNELVVPIFPDPKFLISSWKNIFPTNTPVGRDPIKYAKIKISK